MKGYARLLNLCRKKYRGIENEAKHCDFYREGGGIINNSFRHENYCSVTMSVLYG